MFNDTYRPTNVGPNATISILLGMVHLLVFIVLLIIVIHRGIWRRVVRHLPPKATGDGYDNTCSPSTPIPSKLGDPGYPITPDLFL